jgi:hypothetical protein
VRDGQVVEAVPLLAEVVRDAEQDAEDDQRGRDEPQVTEGVLDGVLEQQPEHGDRDRADDHQPRHA